MGMTDKSLCDSCTNTGCEFQSGIVRTKCAFYMPSQLEPDNCGNYVVQDSTTKNDCAEQNGCISCSLDDGDDCCRKLYEESMQDSTTKNDIRDNRVKNELNRVKDELEPTTKNCESCRYYGSHHEVCNYCYKCSLWTEQNPTIKNDLAVDCISRKSVITIIQNHWWNCRDIDKLVNDLPSVTPQEPRWIPVGERLPEENGGYLVTVKRGYVTTALWVGNAENWKEVTAWMPLPQPYKAEREKT